MEEFAYLSGLIMAPIVYLATRDIAKAVYCVAFGHIALFFVLVARYFSEIFSIIADETSRGAVIAVVSFFVAMRIAYYINYGTKNVKQSNYLRDYHKDIQKTHKIFNELEGKNERIFELKRWIFKRRNNL